MAPGRMNDPFRRFSRIALALSVLGLLAAGWWFLLSDEPTPRDRESLPDALTPRETAFPVVRSSAPLSGAGVSIFAKPVVAADRDRRVVITAMNRTPNGMILLRWRSTDGGRTWAEPAAFESVPTGCDFLGDPWLVTDHRDRYHLVHLSTSMEARNTCPCVYRRSSDGGKTWPLVTRVAEEIDRPVLAVSPNGQRLAIICMMHDLSAPPLTSADLKNAAFTTVAMNRVMTQGVFDSDNRGKTWKRRPAPPGLRHSVPFTTVIDDAGRIAAAWLANDGKGSQSVIGSTADRGKTWSVTALVEALQPDRKHPFNGGRFPVVALDGPGRLQVVYVGAGGTALWARTSHDWTTWSTAIRLSAEGVEEVRNPAISAAGDVVHAIWMERSGERYQMRYRASKDGGTNWSETLTLSRSHPASSLVTGHGFAIGSDDDQSAVADDRAGTAHIVWAVGGKLAGGYAIWHASVEWHVPKR